MVKNPPANAVDIRDTCSIPRSRRSPREEHDSPLWHSCLEKPHGQRSLVGCSLRSHKELDATEWLRMHAVCPSGQPASQSLRSREHLAGQGQPCVQRRWVPGQQSRSSGHSGRLQVTGCRSHATAVLKKKSVITIASLTGTFTSESGHSRLSGGVNYIVAPRPEIHLGLNDRYATRNEGLLSSTGNHSQYLVITYNRK